MKHLITLGLSSVLAACASGGATTAPTTPTTPAPAPASGSATERMDASQVAPLMGYYTGDWGQLVLRHVGDEVWGAYTHDAGGVRGTLFADGHFEGVWCEDPSRAGDQDAGLVRFDFTMNAGVPTIDGTWGYGNATPTNGDWDVVLSKEPAPAELDARFADTTRFCK